MTATREVEGGASSGVKMMMSAADFIGMEIDGRFLLKSKLGEGGMGMVFRARQLSVGRDVALKVMKLDLLGSDVEVSRFEREVDIISGLSHPNIVRLLDSGKIEHLGLYFLAMELVEGVSLEDFLYGGGISRKVKLPLALELAYQLCGALTEPHQLGIVHRDIKPDNVLLQVSSDDTVQVKLLDFGVARAQQSKDNKLTQTGIIVGTPSYMSPEVASGGEIDPRADLYAIGVMLFELLVGELPFYGDTPMAVALKHISEVPPRVDQRNPSLGQYPELVELCCLLLEKNPASRPTTALEVRRTIDEIRDRHGIRRVRVDGSLQGVQALSVWMEAPSEMPEVEATPLDGPAATQLDAMPSGPAADSTAVHVEHRYEPTNVMGAALAPQQSAPALTGAPAGVSPSQPEFSSDPAPAVVSGEFGEQPARNSATFASMQMPGRDWKTLGPALGIGGLLLVIAVLVGINLGSSGEKDTRSGEDAAPATLSEEASAVDTASVKAADSANQEKPDEAARAGEGGAQPDEAGEERGAGASSAASAADPREDRAGSVADREEASKPSSKGDSGRTDRGKDTKKRGRRDKRTKRGGDQLEAGMEWLRDHKK